ncbi:MAG: glycogen synthase [Gammaproteobacteria bacterium]|nr:glycogen synthase [Gammaproteobacteria bacterium]MCP5458115.1 glycogen synthase [Gammaproteobacteria bacterium]
MKIVFLTNEYPPHIYGGAGVHVEYLVPELARLDDGEHTVEVLCFGEQRAQQGNLRVQGVQMECPLPFQDRRHRRFMETLLRDIAMAGSVAEADIVHCHTWYTHLAGCLLKQLVGAKLVLTTHSLEPHRPWKVEQLGTAYQGSAWVEKTAYQNADGVVAVSESMRADVQSLYGVANDIIRVIHNGIDLNQFKPTFKPSVLQAYGIDPEQPIVLFVGRITRQKGIIHLVNAIRHINPGVQIVLCAGTPDTPEIGEEMKARVGEARNATTNTVIWIPQTIAKDELIALYTHASLFVCPSVYEPFGIINLEAMACGTPVVAAAVGGIPEVVVPVETGLLVSFQTSDRGDFEPQDAEVFSRDLADSINLLLNSPETLQGMGLKARQRVEKHFGWTSIARQTLDFYKKILGDSSST